MLPKEILQQIPSDSDACGRWFEENYKETNVPAKLELSGVSATDTLCRFVDLPKLFHLLKTRRLFLPKLRRLIEGDPFECFAIRNFGDMDRAALENRAKELEGHAPDKIKGNIYPPGAANIWEKIGTGKPRFERLIQTISDGELKRVVWQLERERLKEDLVCCCWYKGTRESDAMWKIYAPQLGVMFTTTPARLESAMTVVAPKILADRVNLKLAAVQYNDSGEAGNFEPWLIKRSAFKHEEEVRLYCDRPTWFGIEVNLSELIQEIVISPFANPWQAVGIKGAIEALLKEVGAENIPIRLSDHMRPPEIIWPEEPINLVEELARAGIAGNRFTGLLNAVSRNAAASPSP